jgi:hypothetical protein
MNAVEFAQRSGRENGRRSGRGGGEKWSVKVVPVIVIGMRSDVTVQGALMLSCSHALRRTFEH